MKKHRFSILAAAALLCAGTAYAQAPNAAYLYYVGGAIDDPASANAQDGSVTSDYGVFSVLVADVDITQTPPVVSNWRYATDATNPLPENTQGGSEDFSWLFLEDAVHTYNGRIYVGPGDWNGDDSRGTADCIVYADINEEDGTLGAWMISSFESVSNDLAICGTALVEASGKAYYYVLGGTGSASTDVLKAEIDGTTGAVGTWTTTTALPAGDWFNRGAAVGDLVIHASGNLRDPAGRFVEWATSSASDGTLGAWSSAITYDDSDSSNRWDMIMVPASAGGNDFVVIGGGSANGTVVDTVHVAQVSGGSVGTFATTNPLPEIRRRVAGTSYGDTIFVPGGGPTGAASAATDTVFVGTIDSAGTITWTTSVNPMLQKRSFGGAAVHDFYQEPPTDVEKWEVYR